MSRSLEQINEDFETDILSDQPSFSWHCVEVWNVRGLGSGSYVGPQHRETVSSNVMFQYIV